MPSGLNNSKADRQASPESPLEIVVVNVSVSGSRLGGAAIAAEWHSRFLAELVNVELWRMWDSDRTTSVNHLAVRNYTSKLPLQPVTSRLPRRAQALLLKSDILPQILKIRPKIVHLQNPAPALEFEHIAQVCQQNGIKVVASTHGFYEVFHPNYNWKWYEEYGWQQWMIKPIERSFQHIDAFLSGYPTEKQILLDKGVPEARIHLVPNGVNPYFEQLPTPQECSLVLEKFNISPDQPILLFIGNHTENKGINTVLEVAAHLKSPTTVVIGGKLLSESEPEQRLAQIEGQYVANIIFTDYLSETEQRVLYHSATLLLFPSLADTLPLTVLEAMACGLPVVAYDTGGISYQLEKKSGVLVAQGDKSAFFKAVEHLLEDASAREVIKTNAQRRQRHLFSWDLAAKKTVQIYDSLQA